jgi:hypothetical protein
VGKWHGRMNIMQILCTHVCKWYLLKLFQEWRGDEGEWCREWIQVWYIWYIVRTYANVTMYPHPAQQLTTTTTKYPCKYLTHISSVILWALCWLILRNVEWYNKNSHVFTRFWTRDSFFDISFFSKLS